MISNSIYLFNVQCTLPCVSVLGQVYVLLVSLHTAQPYQLELYCRQIIPVFRKTGHFFSKNVV